MIDFVVFIFAQFGRLILWFDSITIYHNLSLLKFIIILNLIFILFKFFRGGRNND